MLPSTPTVQLEAAVTTPATSASTVPGLTACERFLKNIDLPHLIPLLREEGFTTLEDIARLHFTTKQERRWIFDALSKTYGSGFNYADRLRLAAGLEDLDISSIESL